jgi:acyl-CoA synthetase (AMP-forming)/AMP-acid ligase II
VEAARARLPSLVEHTASELPPVLIGRDDVAEIIFTSGATADPKGVVITHRNVLANIVPVEREVRKHRKWATPFFPLRFLNCCRSATCSARRWRLHPADAAGT